ncbi:MAG: hypothetical protein GDA39_08905 [Hyphomonadaceae bacterium]|nr:hypothetical protein [Hyphomonadaceae bacterium]MBC6412967.1 hypothetical protein [Hyphomonadaceae bacterium]
MARFDRVGRGIGEAVAHGFAGHGDTKTLPFAARHNLKGWSVLRSARLLMRLTISWGKAWSLVVERQFNVFG